MIKGILTRLKNLGTVMAITSLIVGVLVTNGLIVEGETVIKTVQSICSILVLLGIMNNPETEGIDIATKLDE